MANEKKTVLIVDDEVDLADALRFEMEEAGFEAIVLHSGNEAIELLKRQNVDVVISDVRMPNGTGLELLKSVRENNQHQPIFILVTGFSDVTAEEAYNLGAEGVFGKPTKMEKLLEQIQRSLSAPKRRWERVRPPETLKHSLSLTFENIGVLRQSKLLNIGRGGMCLFFHKDPPPIGTTVSFSITFADGRCGPLEGTAIVRWRTTEKDGLENQAGFEFLDLSETSLPRVLELLSLLKPSLYIPGRKQQD